MSGHVTDVTAAPAETTDAPIALVNRTNKRIVITGAGGYAFALAPFERREISLDARDRLGTEIRRLEGLSYVAYDDPPRSDDGAAALYGAGFWFCLIFIVAGLSFDVPDWYWLVGGAVGLVALVTAWRATSSGAVGRWLALTAALVLVLTAGIGLPAASIWFGANLADAAGTAVDGFGVEQELAILTLLGRVLQLVFIAVVALLPALLYFLFDRARLGTLRQRFTRNAFRLDRSLHTDADLQAKYGRLLDEAYGPQESAGTRLQPGTQWPILVATIVIAFGWVLTLLNPGIELANRFDLRSFFRPWGSPIAYAFLGAYVFSLYAVLRGYVRGDLRPKTYGYISVRVIVAIIIAWVLPLSIDPGPELLLAAFAAGIFPDTYIYRGRELARGLLRWRKADHQALMRLDGIDLYERTRLETEGVTNIEALAHHDLVELVLQTRIAVPRLVDWTDQAILHLHMSEADLTTLRGHSIRTATALQRAYAGAVARGPEAEREFLGLLKQPPDGGLQRMQVALDALAQEEWVEPIRYFREHGHGTEETLRFEAPLTA